MRAEKYGKCTLEPATLGPNFLESCVHHVIFSTSLELAMFLLAETRALAFSSIAFACDECPLARWQVAKSERDGCLGISRHSWPLHSSASKLAATVAPQ
jgi:hypothetical protein